VVLSACAGTVLRSGLGEKIALIAREHGRA